jgi:glycosyltransferase involved in cell wall biosynthesis
MQILSVHARYQFRGGEEECRDAEASLLREMGHQVDVYEEDNKLIQHTNPLSLAIQTVWSQDSYQKIYQQLKAKSYDVVHVHNFFPMLSPSVYYAAEAADVPVVQTLHNYRLLCPNGLFFRDNRICEDCLGKPIPWPGAVHGCYRGNHAATTVTAAMLTIHRALRTWQTKVSRYIALTEFARLKFIEGGLPGEKIVVKPNFINPDPEIGEGNGGYALYVGRLSIEKGLNTLLSAWERLEGKMPLKIVGDGPLADQVAEAVTKLPHVEWLGQKSLNEVYALMGDATVAIFPSSWYETFGRIVIESFAKGTPIIVVNQGAAAELVENGRTGLHFQLGDPEDLATKVEWVLSHPLEIAQMRQEARTEFNSKYTGSLNYQKLINIYTLAKTHI